MSFLAALNYLNPLNYFSSSESSPAATATTSPPVEECSICLNSLNEKVESAVEHPLSEIHKTKCNHSFHGACLATWITASNNQDQSCPLCRFKWCVGTILSPGQDQIRHALLEQREERFIELFSNMNEANFIEAINEILSFLSGPFLNDEEDIIKQLEFHFKVQKFLIQALVAIFEEQILPFDRALALFELVHATNLEYTEALDQREDVNQLFLEHINNSDAEKEYLLLYKELITLISKSHGESSAAVN